MAEFIETHLTFDTMFTFSQPGTKRNWDSNDVLQEVAANQPRYATEGGLYIDPIKRNYLPESEDLTTWATAGTGTVVASATVPGPGLNAFLVSDDSGLHGFRIEHDYSVNIPNDQEYTFSVLFNTAGDINDGMPALNIELTGVTTKIYTYAFGAPMGTGVYNVGSEEAVDAGYRRRGDWLECWVTVKVESSMTSLKSRIYPKHSELILTGGFELDAQYDAGLIGDTIVAAPQLEIGLARSAYLPSSGGTEARAVDDLQLLPTAQMDGDVTFVGELDLSNYVQHGLMRRVLAIGSASNYMQMFIAANSLNVTIEKGIYQYTPTTSGANPQPVPLTNNTIKFAISYDFSNDLIRVYMNGGSVLIPSAGLDSTSLERIRFGTTPSTAFDCASMTLKYFKVYLEALPHDVMEDLTV